jgi:hypothetical protein
VVSLGAIPKKPRYNNSSQSSQLTVPSDNRFRLPEARQGGRPVPEPEPAQDQARKKFKDAIREAERSTLIFNLDMGKVPVLNKETMSKRATLSLTSMAARKEKKTGLIPSNEAIDAIDDVLSIVKNMSMLGNTTKTYKHPRDARSGEFCTVPVKYEFSDRDVKANAEKVLRKYCDVQCSTPYPAIVRECIKQIVAEVKKDYPNNFVRVTVDTNDMVFKVTRNAPDTSENPGWHSRDENIPIPDVALDVNARWAPRDFRLVIPPSPSKKVVVQSSAEQTSENDIEMSASVDEAASQSG